MDTNYLKFGKKYMFISSKSTDTHLSSSPRRSLSSNVGLEGFSCHGIAIASNFRNPHDYVGLAHNQICDYVREEASGNSLDTIILTIDRYLEQSFGLTLTTALNRKSNRDEILMMIMEIAHSAEKDALFERFIHSKEGSTHAVKFLKEVYEVVKASDMKHNGSSVQHEIDAIISLEAKIMGLGISNDEMIRLLYLSSIARHSIYHWSVWQPPNSSDFRVPGWGISDMLGGLYAFNSSMAGIGGTLVPGFGAAATVVGVAAGCSILASF